MQSIVTQQFYTFKSIISLTRLWVPAENELGTRVTFSKSFTALITMHVAQKLCLLLPFYTNCKYLASLGMSLKISQWAAWTNKSKVFQNALS